MKSIEDSLETTVDKAQLILFTRYVKIISATILVITLLVVIGWIFDKDILKSIYLDWASMKIQTASCFVFSALSLYLLT
ncbi:MAG: hypothetical protein NTW85_07090 [Methylococcales bacterium]|nr:hypothetical protein [Methylococcales bacterium]